MDEQRAEFEAWAHKSPANLAKDAAGGYQSSTVAFAWRAVQAATQRQQERIAYVEKVADDAIELGNQQAIRIAALEAQVSALTTALFECREAFPIPESGSPVEPAWMGAMTDPEDVPEYIKEQAQALWRERDELASFVIEVGGYWGQSKSVLVGPDSLANVLNRAVKDATRYEYLTREMGDLCITYAYENTAPVLKAESANQVIDAAIAAGKGEVNG